MTDLLDELLSKARFTAPEPYTGQEIDAAHQRLAARLAARNGGSAPARWRDPTRGAGRCG